MPNPVTTVDVVERWRPLSETEETICSALLDDAWAMVLSLDPTIETRLGVTLNYGIITAVLSAMVLRVMRNPEGKRSEAIDDYSWTRDSSVAAGFLYLTDDEIAMLAAHRAARAFTIKPGNPSWMPQVWGGDYS